MENTDVKSGKYVKLNQVEPDIWHAGNTFTVYSLLKTSFQFVSRCRHLFFTDGAGKQTKHVNIFLQTERLLSTHKIQQAFMQVNQEVRNPREREGLCACSRVGVCL